MPSIDNISLRNIIFRWEDANLPISVNEQKERIIIYDKRGNFVFKRTGTYGGVNFDDAYPYIRQNGGKIAIHTHQAPEALGGDFSIDDIKCVLDLDLTEMHACDKKYRYMIIAVNPLKNIDINDIDYDLNETFEKLKKYMCNKLKMRKLPNKDQENCITKTLDIVLSDYGYKHVRIPYVKTSKGEKYI